MYIFTSSEMCSKSACSTICPARMDSHRDPWVASSNEAPAMCLPEPSRLSPNRCARGNLVTFRMPSISAGCSIGVGHDDGARGEREGKNKQNKRGKINYGVKKRGKASWVIFFSGGLVGWVNQRVLCHP